MAIMLKCQRFAWGTLPFDSYSQEWISRSTIAMIVAGYIHRSNPQPAMQKSS